MKMKILTFPAEKCKKDGLIFNPIGEKAMNIPKAINPSDYQGIVFFTGAGMSAESGLPTYRGAGVSGINTAVPNWGSELPELPELAV